MPGVHVDNPGEMAIIEGAEQFVRTAAASKLQDAVPSRIQARVVLLDQTEMHAPGGGLDGLVLLQIATLEPMMSFPGPVDREHACAFLESRFPFPHLSRYA